MEKKRFSVRETFGVTAPEGVSVEGYAGRGPFVPEVDPLYRFERSLLSDVLAWLEIGGKEGLYLTGPTGSGKSSMVCQVAARLNIPVQRVAGHHHLEASDLIGHHTVLGGDMVFVDGPLTAAMRHGHLFLVDELDMLEPGAAAGLNAVLEGAPLVIAENGGEVVEPHRAFRFAATGNTAGAGDETGLYQGTVRQNMAFLDRFWSVHVDYMPEEHELEVIEQAEPRIPKQVREAMVRTANHVRTLFKGEEHGEPRAAAAGAVELTMSTRVVVRWARLAWFFRAAKSQGVDPVHHALDRAIAFRAEPATRRAMHEILQRELGG